MKSIGKTLAVAALLIAATKLEAARTVYNSALVNEPGLAYNNQYTLDLTSQPLDQLSFQAVYATTTFSNATFTDGAASTGSITVVSTAAIHGVLGTDSLTVVSGKNAALAAAKGSDTLNVALNTAGGLAGASVKVNGTTIKFNRDFFLGVSSNATATSLAGAISAMTPFTASASGSTVTITCPAIGTGCNSYALTSSTATVLVVGSAKFTGGQDAVFFTLAGTRLTNGKDWSTGFTSTATAANLTTAASSVNGFTATASSNVVTVSCTSSGTFCNAFTLATSSSAALSIGGATFSGGVTPVRLAINGTVLTEGPDFTATTSSAVTASNIAAAINANSILSAVVSASTGPIGVVTTTSTAVGSGTNYSLWSSNYTNLKPFAPAMKGGTASAILTATGGLKIAAHGYTTALPVMFRKTTGSTPGQLLGETTYYVIVTDANNLKLASSQANAIAGTAVGLSTQTALGGGSFQLRPAPFTGTPSFKWQESNDNANWYDLSVTSVTFSSPYTPSNQGWDFSAPNYEYYRLNVVGPTQGGMKLVVTGNGKSNNPYRP